MLREVENDSSNVRFAPSSLGSPGSSSVLPDVHCKSSSQILAAPPGPISSCVNGPLGSQTSYPMLVLLCWTQTADSCTMTHVSYRNKTGCLGFYIPVLNLWLPFMMIMDTSTDHWANIWELTLGRGHGLDLSLRRNLSFCKHLPCVQSIGDTLF